MKTIFPQPPLGDGLAARPCLYSLSPPPPPPAQADNPAAEGSVVRTLPAKEQHIEVLRVKNWLQKPQRFKVGGAHWPAQPCRHGR